MRFSAPPFRKAPFLLWRHRVVLAAVTGAGAILGLVVALTPQFLSSSASSLYERELAGRCDSFYAGLIDPHRGAFVPMTEQGREDLTRYTSTDPNLEPPRATAIGPTVAATIENGATFPFVPIYRTGFKEHLEVLEGGEGGGVWLDEYAARTYEIEVGDTLNFTAPVFTLEGEDEEIVVSLPVTAITVDKVEIRNLDYWCGIEDYLGLTTMGDRKPPVGLIEIETFRESGLDRVSQEYWEIPVDYTGLSLTRVDEILDVFDALSADLLRSNGGEVFTEITAVRERVVSIRDALETSIRPLALVVTVVALALVAGAASYWVDRRRDELRLLDATGFGPASLGVKAGLEMFLPLLLGVALGAGMSIPLAVLVGPGGAIESVAREAGFKLSVPAFGTALLVVGLVGYFRTRGLLSSQRRAGGRQWILRFVTIALLLAAVMLRSRFEAGTVVFEEGSTVGSVDPAIVFFPLLIFGAVAFIAAQGLLVLVRILGHSATGDPAYLAVRRILSSSTPAVVFFVAALVPAATLVFSTALTRSAETTVNAKGRVFIGSDLRAPVFGLDTLPPVLAERATYVSRAERVNAGGEVVEFMVVDTESFSRGAFWDPSFSEASLEELLDRIEDPASPLDALVANGDSIDGRVMVELDRIEVPIEVVGRAVSFPGSRADRPIVVVSRSAWDAYVGTIELPPNGSDGTIDYLWAMGRDFEAIETQMNEADIGYAFTTTVDEALDVAKFQVIIWTFDVLELYAVLAGMMVVGGILLYADTRQRARNLSYALARRMGLRRREHFIAGAFEFGSLALGGTLVGGAAAIVAARSLYSTLDALPGTPPGPIWSGAFDVAVVMVLAAVGVGLAAAYVAQRTADNADISELLRHGG